MMFPSDTRRGAVTSILTNSLRPSTKAIRRTDGTGGVGSRWGQPVTTNSSRGGTQETRSRSSSGALWPADSTRSVLFCAIASLKSEGGCRCPVVTRFTGRGGPPTSSSMTPRRPLVKARWRGSENCCPVARRVPERFRRTAGCSGHRVPKCSRLSPLAHSGC